MNGNEAFLFLDPLWPSLAYHHPILFIANVLDNYFTSTNGTPRNLKQVLFTATMICVRRIAIYRTNEVTSTR